MHWYFNDHLGTPVLTTDTTGAVDWRVEREPYGAIYATRTGAERHQPLAFPGQEDGGELSYNVFRWYRAGWGRYSQSDPIGLESDINLFRYGLSNPVNSIDPLGLAVLVRCRIIGTPGKFALDTYIAGKVLGIKHCFLQVTCPKKNIGPTLLSYLGKGVTVGSPDSLGNNDATYTQMGDYSQSLVKPKGSNGCCQFEKCLIDNAKKMVGQKMPLYKPYGPNSNTFVYDLVNGCGGVPPDLGDQLTPGYQ